MSTQTQLRGVTWRELADGRPHRLKRGKQFTGDVRALQQEAEAVAEHGGRGLLAVRDLLGNKNQYLWVQFADQLLPPGSPCRCGGREFLRLHDRLARCASCGATAVLEQDDAGRPKDAWRPGQRLGDYEDLELVARDDEASDDRLERWYGRATDPLGWTVLVQVDFMLEEGRRIPDPADETQDQYVLRRWPLRPFVTAAQLGVLDEWLSADALRRLRDQH